MADTRRDVEQYLASKGWAWKERAGQFILDCPFCGKPGHFYVAAETGLWDCKLCGRSGNLWQLRQELGDVLAVQHLQHAAPTARRAPVSRPADLPTDAEWEAAERALWAGGPASDATLDDLLRARKLPAEVVRAARLGLFARWKEPLLGIPYMRNGRLVSLKLRSIRPAAKAFKRVEGTPSLLYGAESLAGHDEVVLVEGELDVLAMRAYGVEAVASTSLGARGWAGEWTPALENAKTILLAYDQDTEGDAGAAALAQKLGVARCLRVRLPHKDACECLGAGVPAETIRAALAAAEPVTGPRVRHLAAFAPEALHDAELGCGEPTPWPDLTNLIAGIRRGDLCVVTGRTGDGKSTWLIDLAVRRADAGAPVLFFPSEQKPVDVFRKAAARYVDGPWHDVSPWARENAAAEIARLPLYLLAHYGRVEPSELFGALRYAVTRLCVRDVVLDHLHFFWPLRGGDAERTDIGDAIRMVKVWAQDLGITIWLVVQPGKTKAPVTLADLRGSVELEQTPDVVIVVERKRRKAKDKDDRDKARLKVQKVRFEAGNEGIVTLDFDRRKQTFYESAPEADEPPTPDGEELPW